MATEAHLRINLLEPRDDTRCRCAERLIAEKTAFVSRTSADYRNVGADAGSGRRVTGISFLRCNSLCIDSLSPIPSPIPVDDDG
jgi:hypothetical protein